MRNALATTGIVAALILLTSGCGGGSTATTASNHGAATNTSVEQAETPAALEGAVRRAVNENHALLTHALLTNSVPSNPQGTAGPALADVRRSAAERKAQGTSVRILSENFRVLGVELDPSYTTATATILNLQKVQPLYGVHRRPGAPSPSREHVRLELHRIGNADRFVVWKVTLLR
jgi:hypothetical protein